LIEDSVALAEEVYDFRTIHPLSNIVLEREAPKRIPK